MTPEQQQKLERLVTHAVRDLPARRAPVSLEGRVQAEIARRAALPWWRKSFLSWPLAARAVFVVASVALVRVLFITTGWLGASAEVSQAKAVFASELHWLRVARVLLDTLLSSAQAVIDSVSPVVLYGGVAAVFALYVTLFGLGAAAYRTLYANR